MQLRRTVGVSAVALGLFVAASGSALAGADTVGSVPMAGKDSGPAPSAVMPACVSNAPAAVGASKDSAGQAPSAIAPAGQAPASVAAAPGRAGGVDPSLLGTLLGGSGLLTLASGLVLHRKRS
jgi:hypothetical protein